MSRLTLEQIQALIPNQDQFISSMGWIPYGESEDGTMRYMTEDGNVISRGGFTDTMDTMSDYQKRVLAGSGVLPMQGNWSTDYADLGQPIYATEQDYLRQLYGGGDQVGDYFVLPENNLEGRFVGTPLVNNRKSTAFQDFLKGAALLAGAGMGMNAISGALAGSGAGAASAAGSGWTSGFDLPMGDFGGSWNLGSAAAPEGFSVAASLPEAASPALGSSEFSLVGAQAGNPGGGLYSGAFEGPSLVSSGNPGGFGLTGTASPGTLLTPQMAQSMGLPASAAMGGAGLTAMQAAGGVSTAANAAQAGSALSRFLGGNSTTQDNLSLLGNLAGTGLGLLGARQQSNAMGDIANRYLDMGAPYRSLLQQSYQPGFSMANQPDFQNAMDVGAQAAARATSARAGNPVENPGAYAEMQKYITGSLALPQLNTYRGQLGQFGGLGLDMSGKAQMGQVGAQGSGWEALGSGVENIFNPRRSIFDNPEILRSGLLGRPQVNTGNFF